MYFNKYPFPANFRFMNHLRRVRARGPTIRLREGRRFLEFTLLRDGLLRATSGLWSDRGGTESFAELTARPLKDAEIHEGRSAIGVESGESRLLISPRTGEFTFRHGGTIAVRTGKRPFGVCGAKSLTLLDRPAHAVVYGLGEKTGRLDKANQSYKMWTVDTVADLPHSYMRDDFDPTYVAIPFFISKCGESFYGILLDSPQPSFFHLGFEADGKRMIQADSGRDPRESFLAFGTYEGLLEFYVIPGPTLAEVVRRFARLTGRHELPPHWALGYQQCRWGYRSARELGDVSDRLAEEGLPTGAIWADIDHMDGYRVFTWDPERFRPGDRKALLRKLGARGTKLVTITDPGVKAEPGYAVYEEGKREDVFCKTPEGAPYFGYVWPGKTVFPDFSLPEGREFWARHIRAHVAGGVAGIWNDMNDPVSGPVELDDMRFRRGRADHSVYHNQYGHLMAKATWEGFRQQDPNQRPFILTRSGYTGTQKYAAIWTGDNCSSESHLAMAIPMSLNLALSGVSFNGPDVGGFAGDTTEDLMVAWMLAGALFPFFRNHSSAFSRRQEPYAFSRRALSVMRNCILTRAMLLPYVYNQFYLHTRHGDATMRPVSYEFPGERHERLDDQYMIGPSVMVAPFVGLQAKTRTVVLPPGWWFSFQTGQWVRGGRTVPVQRSNDMMVFVRDGSILPCVERVCLVPQPDFRRIAFHVFCRSKGARIEYYEDDGTTRGYQNGLYNLLSVIARKTRGELAVRAGWRHRGWGKGLRFARFSFYGLGCKGANPGRVRWPFRSYRALSRVIEIPRD